MREQRRFVGDTQVDNRSVPLHTRTEHITNQILVSCSFVSPQRVIVEISGHSWESGSVTGAGSKLLMHVRLLLVSGVYETLEVFVV